MKKVHVLWVLACLLAAPVLFQSCSDDDDEVYVWYPYLSPNALVTVKGGTDSCFLQLDDETTNTVTACTSASRSVRASACPCVSVLHCIPYG